MSLTRCLQCDDIWDTDEFPEGYYDPETGEARDHYLCQHCTEDDTAPAINHNQKGF